ncbi:MAG: nuclear transport factor 2 family protein [Caulobacterales bacterium]
MSEAEDRDEIRQLIATYTIEGDRGNVAKLVTIFADDAVMEIPTWRAIGPKAIFKALGGGPSGTSRVEVSPAPAAQRRIVRHHLTSSLITLDGPDDASGRNYWINYSENGPDHSGLYSDKYKRINGRWKVVRREVRLDWKASDSRLGPDMHVGPRPADAGPLREVTAD